MNSPEEQMPSSPRSPGALVSLFVAGAACFGAAAIGSLLTEPNLPWYETLAKPWFTPPNTAFPLAWTLLYGAMAVSAWLVWRAPGSASGRQLALTWFGIQLILNVLWSFAFFWLHSPAFGLAVIMVLLLAIAGTIVVFDRSSRVATLLLMPYLLWVAFATALNVSIWILNPSL
jgi:translocator protein